MSSKITNVQYSRRLREYILNGKLAVNTSSISPIINILTDNYTMVEKAKSKSVTSMFSHLYDDRNYILSGNDKLSIIFQRINQSNLEMRSVMLTGILKDKSFTEFVVDYNLSYLLPEFLLTALVVETNELFDYDNPSRRYKNIYLPFDKHNGEYPTVVLEKIRLSCNHGAVNLKGFDLNTKSGTITFYDPYNDYYNDKAYHYSVSLKKYLRFLDSAEKDFTQLQDKQNEIKSKTLVRSK